jgi:hypothetical protein
MVRVVLTIGCLGFVLSAATLWWNLHHPAALVANVLALGASGLLTLAAYWKLRLLRRGATEEDAGAARDRPRR